MTAVILETLWRTADGSKDQKKEKCSAELQQTKGEYLKDYIFYLQKKSKTNNQIANL